ncbi:ketoacyl-ACP synthase III family protein [Streptomyces sp. NPDC003753]
MKVDDIYLAGVGTHLPPAVPTEQAVKAGWWDADAREASGIESVTVESELPAPEMAVRAARTALRRSGHRPEDFASLLHTGTFSQGQEGWSAQHYVLLHTLATPISAVEVRQGCLGMLSALGMAAAQLAAAPEGKDAVLLTGADTFSTPLVDRWRAMDLFVLGDAGSALVVSRRSGFARLLAVGSLSDPHMEWRHRDGRVQLPPQQPQERLMDFQSRSDYWRRKWAEGHTPPGGSWQELCEEAVQRTLAEAGTAIEDIARVVTVSFTRDALAAMFLEPLGIDISRSTWEMGRRTGHASVNDLAIGLEYLWTTGQVVPGDRVLLVGATPGMECGCAVVEITAPPTGETDAVSG